MLIEIIISLLIIGVVLVLYQAALNSVFLSRNTKDSEIGLRVASHKIEELRAAGYSNLPASGAFTDPQLNSVPNSSASLSVSDLNARTKEVSVTVQWREPNSNADHAVTLSTLITQIGGLQ